MLQQIKLKNIGLLFFFLSAIPSTSFALTTCATLATKPIGTCVGGDCDDSTADVFFVTYQQPIATVEISLSDYSKYIEAVLEGQPLAAVSVPMCFGVFTNLKAGDVTNPTGPGVWNDDNMEGDHTWTIQLRLSGEEIESPYPGIKMPSGNTWFLSAQSQFCPCGTLPNISGSEIGVEAKCTAGTVNIVPNATTPLLTNTDTENSPSTGICTEGTPGGFLFNIYAPDSGIPPVGEYTLDFSVGVCPPGQACD